jgi:FeS assembly protein IscX
MAPQAFLLPLNVERPQPERRWLPRTRLRSGGTMNELHWSDAEDLGIELYEKHPTTDPLSLRFTELHRLVIELKAFEDDPAASSEATLESIQMAWYDEWKDNQP